MLTPLICNEIKQRYSSMLEAIKAGDLNRFSALQDEVRQLRADAEHKRQASNLSSAEVEELRVELARVLKLDREINDYLLTLHEETRKMLRLEKHDQAVRSAYQSPGF